MQEPPSARGRTLPQSRFRPGLCEDKSIGFDSRRLQHTDKDTTGGLVVILVEPIIRNNSRHDASEQ